MKQLHLLLTFHVRNRKFPSGDNQYCHQTVSVSIFTSYLETTFCLGHAISLWYNAL